MPKRAMLEVDEELFRKLTLYCFIRGISMREFATWALSEKLKPYEQWLRSIRRLKLRSLGVDIHERK